MSERAFSETAHLGAFDVAVIGAGPAGMAAAATAAEHGLRVALLDGGRQLGGQYFRHPAPGLTAPWLPRLYHGWQHFEQLVTRVETASGIEVLFGHQVWAIEQCTDPAFRVLTDRGPVEARTVVLATGAYERVVPFPGWDLPGVFTAGGAQALLKGNLVLPGHRVIVAGTGPLLLPVAAGLATAGAQVLGLYEANNIRGYAKNPLPLITNPAKLAEGLDYARQFTRARIPVHTGRMVIEAQGTDSLEAVITARPDGSDSRRIECDTLAIGYGLAPQIDLALTLGAKHRQLTDGTIGLRVDRTLRTSIPGLYAAGETAGVAGAEAALVEGEIAGLAIAALFRRSSTPAAARPASPAFDTPTISSSGPAPAEPKPTGSQATSAAARPASPNPDTPTTSSSAPKPTSLAARAKASARARLSRPVAGTSTYAGTTEPPASRATSAVTRSASASLDTPTTSSSPAEPAGFAARAKASARARLSRPVAGTSTYAGTTDPAVDKPSALPALHRRRARQRALADLLRARHPIPDAWRAHLTPDTVVCRCEEVPASTITEAVTEFGAGDARTVKLLTRAGMGWCQGRVCGYAVACLAARDPADSPSEADLLAAAKRPLARPLPLGVLAEQDRRNK